MKYPYLRFVVIAALLALTGCKDEAKEEISDTFDSYVAAIRSNDGAAAVALIDEKYFEDVSYLLAAAQSAPRERVFRMRPTERATIAAIRNRFTVEELKGLDGRGLIKLLIEKRDPEESDLTDLDVSITNIKFKPPRATAEMVLDEFSVKFLLEFVEIDHQWKINPAAFDEKFDKLVEKVSVRSGMREDTLLEMRESRISGKTVTGAIWDPPK